METIFGLGLTHHKERKKEILIHKVCLVFNVNCIFLNLKLMVANIYNAYFILKMLDLIQKFVDYIISNVPDTRRQEAVEEHFLSTIPICTKYCLILGRQ